MGGEGCIGDKEDLKCRGGRVEEGRNKIGYEERYRRGGSRGEGVEEVGLCST